VRWHPDRSLGNTEYAENASNRPSSHVNLYAIQRTVLAPTENVQKPELELQHLLQYLEGKRIHPSSMKIDRCCCRPSKIAARQGIHPSILVAEKCAPSIAQFVIEQAMRIASGHVQDFLNDSWKFDD
jgi:hypothetical protein